MAVDSTGEQRVGFFALIGDWEWAALGISVLGLSIFQVLPELRRIWRWLDSGDLVMAGSMPRIDLLSVAIRVWPVILALAILAYRKSGPFGAVAITSIASGIERLISTVSFLVFVTFWPWIRSSSRRYPGSAIAYQEMILASLLAWSIAWLVIGLRARKNEIVTPNKPLEDSSEGMLRFLSWAFALVLIGMQTFHVYEVSLERIPSFRRMILGRERTPPPPPPRREGSAEEEFRAASELISDGVRLSEMDEFPQAKEAYSAGLQRIEALSRAYPKDGGIRRELALASNNLAWLLSTCPDPKLRDAKTASTLAIAAVKFEPESGMYWNTLGAAHYRVGQLNAAEEAFKVSMSLRSGGDAADWFFLALIEADRNRMAKAREWYDRGVLWIEQNDRNLVNGELDRFRVEAAARFGEKAPEPRKPVPPASRRGGRGPR